ncbi:phospholipase D family protein [Rhizobium leguminosarum]|uniref:Phospholipase D-like domain-containing protein n=1 Tax=Rhizobium leguminosarum TaxID=384 RepID=A0A7M3DW68_RHILE|nr:phospholipase D family protein [Rhizobium leguminosarum]TAY52938.1 hypothetical protein ELH90_15540 [Rhizobium leguminosarum]
MLELSFSPRALLASHAWTSVFFTTYSLSLSFLEAIPMAAVNRSYRDFTVVTDVAGYRSSLADVGAVGIGRDYNLVPVQCSTGVFHPKIGLFSDQDGEVRATVGSGNLSFGGWGYNNEVLEVLRPGRDSACFSGLADLIEAIQREARPGGFLDCLRAPDLHNYVSLARRSSLVPGSGTGRLLHTMAGTLTSQIAGLVDELGGAEELTVVSPFFSAHHGIAALAQAVGCDNLQVAVPPRAPSVFDFAAASAAGLKVRPVSCDEFNDSRPLHSKLFDIGCRQGRLIVSGSANATVQALGRANVEAVVARIHDRAPLFGWIAANAQGCQTTGEEAPQEEERASLAVDYEAGVIRGRVMGGGVTAGTWTVSIAWGARREAGPDVVIDEDGYFAFKPPSSFDPMRVGSSVQLILLREAAEIRGWLILRGFIDAMNRRGPIARSLGRMIAGVETLNDLTAIMEYVSREPRAFIEAAQRTGGGRSDREQAAGLKVIRPFAAGDAFELSHDGLRGSGIVSNGDELIDALVRMLATVTPHENDDSGDDEEEDEISLEGGSENRKQGGGKESKGGGGTQRVKPQVMEVAFNRLFAELVRVPAGPARAPGLFLVFDMIAKIAPRSSLGEELVPRLLAKWLQTAVGSRPVDVDSTGLDECVAATVCRLVIGDPGKARAMHEFLQAWTGGEVPEEFVVFCEPQAGKLNEEALAPGTTQSQWSEAWSSILATRTPWNRMNDLRKALAEKNCPYEPPSGATTNELAMISRYSAREGRLDRIVWMESKAGHKPGCPRCGFRFPGLSQSRFKRNRIATCDNFHCGRVVVDVSL